MRCMLQVKMLRHLLAGTPASSCRLCAKSKPARGMRRGRPSGNTGDAKGLHGPRRVSMSAVQHCPRTRPPGAQRHTRSRAHPRLAPTMLQRVQRKARLYANCMQLCDQLLDDHSCSGAAVTAAAMARQVRSERSWLPPWSVRLRVRSTLPLTEGKGETLAVLVVLCRRQVERK